MIGFAKCTLWAHPVALFQPGNWLRQGHEIHFLVLFSRKDSPCNYSSTEESLIAFAFDLSEADGNEPSADHLLGNIIKDSWARQPQDYRFHPHPDYHQPTRSFSSIWRFGWVLSTSWNWSQFRSNPPLSPPQSIIYANVIAVLLQKC